MIEKYIISNLKKEIHFLEKKELFILSMWKLTLGYHIHNCLWLVSQNPGTAHLPLFNSEEVHAGQHICGV
jgi:hypothetical protein